MKRTKPTTNFDLKHCLKGLGLFLIHSHSHAYDYCFYLTFKKSLKTLSGEFRDADDHQITDIDFFRDIDDPMVRHAYHLLNLLVAYLQEYMLRNGLHDMELIGWNDRVESDRYAPTWFYFGYKTSYLKISLAYGRYVQELANTLYYYCCALSLKSYKIPLGMRTGLDYSFGGSFKHLNVEDYEVNSLIELIDTLQEQDVMLKKIMKK